MPDFLYTQCSHQDFASGSRRAPSTEKYGPLRMLEGQKLKITRGPSRTWKKSFVFSQTYI